MSSRRRLLWGGLLCLLSTPLIAAERAASVDSGVIRDPNWRIQILSSAQANRVVQANAPRPESVAAVPAGPTLLTQGAANAPLKVPAGDPTKEPKKLQETPVEMEGEPHVTTVVVPTMTYAEAYNTVGFRRSEYEANPGYRHETALELMFQTLRPTTVVKQYVPRASRYPDFYQYPYARYPYSRMDVFNHGGVMGIPYNVYSTR